MGTCQATAIRGLRRSAATRNWNRRLETEYGPDFRYRLTRAPLAEKVGLHIVSPRDRLIARDRKGVGRHLAAVKALEPSNKHRSDGRGQFPDPASRLQPEGVHGPSEAISDDFAWQDSLRSYMGDE